MPRPESFMPTQSMCGSTGLDRTSVGDACVAPIAPSFAGANPGSPAQTSKGAITRDTIAMTLIKMFILGPEVSLKGSPTVSPTTVAA